MSSLAAASQSTAALVNRNVVIVAEEILRYEQLTNPQITFLHKNSKTSKFWGNLVCLDVNLIKYNKV